MSNGVDLVLVNPGGREKVYQQLGSDLTAIEPPLWCRLIAGFVRDRGYSVAIIDSEAEELGPESVARKLEELSPTLVGMVVFGHQPSASTQQMVGAGDICRAVKEVVPNLPIIIVGGHVSALPERTLIEEAVDFACKGEGPSTIVKLIDALKQASGVAGSAELETVEGLVWSNNGKVVINKPAELIKDLDADLHGNV